MFKKLCRSRAGVIGVIIAILMVAVGSVVGLTVLALSKSTFDGMNLATAANSAMSTTTANIYNVWPMFSVVVLAMVGALAISSFSFFRGGK